MKKIYFVFFLVLLLCTGLIWYGCENKPANVTGPATEIQQVAKPAPGAVGLERAMAVQDEHSPGLMAIPDVVGTATGLGADGRPAIVVLTRVAGVAGIPRNLDGIPVIVKVTGEIRALQGDEDPTNRFPRPVPIGVSTGHPAITAGTIGARVKDDAGNVYALSNNHVYADENNASIGDNVLQPGSYDGGTEPDDVIGTLFDFEPIVFHPRARNEIDAAIALSSTDELGNATPSDEYGTPKSATVSAEVGQAVQKYGRTTSLTTGTITGINATVRVSYNSGKAIFVNQIMIESDGSFSAGGDSGSLVVTYPDCNPVGLLFAGSVSVTIANRIDLVLERFNVTIDGGEAPPPPPLTIGSISGTVTNASGETAIAGATISLDTGQSTTTASDGTYTITDVPTGDRSVTASADGFESQTKPAIVNENQETIVDFALDEASAPSNLSITVGTDKDTYKIKDTVHISGRVTDETSTYVEGATVKLVIDPPKGPNLTPVNPPVTDGNGEYSFNFKTSNRTGTGTYTVTTTAEKDGVQSNTASKNFEVTK